MSKPSYKVLCVQAVAAIKDRKGASRQAIKKWMAEKLGSDVQAGAHRTALKKAVEAGLLVQEGARFKGTDAGRASIAPKKAKKPAAKKPAAKKSAKKSTKKSAKKSTKKSGSMYVTIKGKKYDKGMVDAANAATATATDNLISIEDAKKLLKETLDGHKYTACEKATMKYIRDNYKFTEKADAYTRTAISSFAAKQGAKKAAKKAGKKSTKKSTKKSAKKSAKKPAKKSAKKAAQK
jgi:hypothetical protein